MRLAPFLLATFLFHVVSPLSAQINPTVANFARTNWSIGAGTIALSAANTSLDFYRGTVTISSLGNISGKIEVRRFPSGSSAASRKSAVITNYIIHPTSKISGPLSLDQTLSYSDTDWSSGLPVARFYTTKTYSADLFLSAGGTLQNPVLTSKTRADLTLVRQVIPALAQTNNWIDYNSIYAAIYGREGVRGLLIISDPRVY
jgi:hypothetical protein